MDTKSAYYICEHGTDKEILMLLQEMALPICMLKIILKRDDLKSHTLAFALKDKAYELSRLEKGE